MQESAIKTYQFPSLFFFWVKYLTENASKEDGE